MAYTSLRIVAAALISVAVLKTEAQQCTIPTSIQATWIDRLDRFRNTWTSTIDATGTTWKKVPPTLFSPRMNCESTSGTVATSFYFVTKVFNVKDCNEIKLRGNMLLMRYKAVPQGEQHTASNCSYIIPTNGEYLLRVKYPIDQAGVQCPFNDGSYQVTYSQSSSVKDQCSGDAESTAEVSGSQLNINSCYSGPAAYDKPYKVNFTCMGTVAGADIDSDANGKGLLLSYTANDGTTMFYCARYKTDGSAFNMSLNVFDWERWGCPIGADYNKFEDSSSSKFRAFTFTVPTTTVAPTTLSIKSTSAVDPATKAETTRSLTTDNTVKSTAEDTKKPLTTAATRSQSTPSSNVGVTTVQTTEGTLPATTTSTEGVGTTTDPTDIFSSVSLPLSQTAKTITVPYTSHSVTPHTLIVSKGKEHSTITNFPVNVITTHASSHVTRKQVTTSNYKITSPVPATTIAPITPLLVSSTKAITTGLLSAPATPITVLPLVSSVSTTVESPTTTASVTTLDMITTTAAPTSTKVPKTTTAAPATTTREAPKTTTAAPPPTTTTTEVPKTTTTAPPQTTTEVPKTTTTAPPPTTTEVPRTTTASATTKAHSTTTTTTTTTQMPVTTSVKVSTKILTTSRAAAISTSVPIRTTKLPVTTAPITTTKAPTISQVPIMTTKVMSVPTMLTKAKDARSSRAPVPSQTTIDGPGGTTEAGNNICSMVKPCQNGALCKPTGKDTYFCSCTDAFKGKNCTTPVDRKTSGLSADEIRIIMAMVILLAAIIVAVVVVSLVVCHFRQRVNKIPEKGRHLISPDETGYSVAGSKSWYPDYVRS